MRVIFINDYNSFSIVWTGERSRGGRCRQNSSRPVVCTVITCAADGKILNAPIVRNHMVTLWSPWKQSWDLLTCEQRLEAETSWKWIYFNADPLHQEEEEKNMVSLWMRACSPVKNLLWGDRWCPPGICSRLESPPYQPTESSAEGHTPVSRRKHPGKKRKQEAMRGGGVAKEQEANERPGRGGRLADRCVCPHASVRALLVSRLLITVRERNILSQHIELFIWKQESPLVRLAPPSLKTQRCWSSLYTPSEFSQHRRQIFF